MKKIYKIHDVVKKILELNPKARNSDTYLYLRYVREYYPTVASMPFDYVLEHRNELGLPNIESVGRARRKIQSEYPALSSSKEVLDAKFEKFKEFRDYANH